MMRCPRPILALPLLLISAGVAAQEPPTASPTSVPAPASEPTAAVAVSSPASPAVIPVAVVVADAPPPALPPPAPPYSVPWAVRGIIPVTSIRLDTAIGFFDRADTTASNPMGLETSGQTAVLMPSATYKFTPNLMGIWRWGFVANSPPAVSGLNNAISISNMAIGAMYGVKLPASFRLGLFLAMTIPIGTGGYGSLKTGVGDPNTTEATKSAVLDREGMDNVMFAVNDVSAVFGIDAAYVGHGLTVQLEFTLLQLMRVKNEFFQADQFRTNSTAGLHLGYFATRWLSVGAELRYQRFLSDPAAVLAGTQSRDNLSIAVGPRFHFKTARGWFRPSLAYAPGLAGDLKSNHYHVLLVDLPCLF